MKHERADDERDAEHDGECAQGEPKLARKQAPDGGPQHAQGTRLTVSKRFIRSSTLLGRGLGHLVDDPAVGEEDARGRRRTRRSGRG